MTRFLAALLLFALPGCVTQGALECRYVAGKLICDGNVETENGTPGI